MARLGSRGMRVRAEALAALAALASSGTVASPQAPAATALLADPAQCRIVRLSDIGWTDVTTTTAVLDRKSTRLNSSHVEISYAVFCLKKKKKKRRKNNQQTRTTEYNDRATRDSEGAYV